MIEYIKREDALDKFKRMPPSPTKDFIIETLNAIPAADVEPVVHAHWEWKAPYMVCSACNRHSINRYRSKRCQHCGAHMERSGE